MVETTPSGETASESKAASAQSATLPTDDRIPLPRFIARQPDGLYLVLNALESPAEFLTFVDRLFSSDMRFSDLNYAVLQKFLYDCGTDDIARLVRQFEAAGRPPMMKLAGAVLPFPKDRQKCYRDPKLIEGGDAAEYLFEPVFVEHEGGASKQADQVVERVTLDIDEFIAAMWCKAVRFGIGVAAAKAALAADISERLVIARMREPTEGQDASVVELLTSMRRDNAPKLLADGRVDLHQFENRFPQVARDTRLIKKIPRVLGKSGWGVAGNEIVSPPPGDFDLETMAGLGTRVDRTAEGEFVVANLGGFLQIDAASQSFSITDKIINTEGVSMRTTGNLALQGDEYEEHGVVQEKAQIEGKHMTFMADVFGDIVSQGGRVVLKKNLVAGSIKDTGGAITVEGNASRATLEAPGGDINVNYAENCRIVGVKVSIEKAVFCEVLAQELTVGCSEGSMLAAEKIQVGSAAARRDVETTISVLVPDMSFIKMQLEELNRRQREAALAVQSRRAEVEGLTGQAEIKTYLLLSGKLASKELVMTGEQAANFQKLVAKLAPNLKRLKAANEELRAATIANDTLVKKILDVTREATRRSTNASCTVGEIVGDTVIRTLVKPPDHAGLELLPPRELRARLRESGADSTILLSGSDGKFAWRMVEPDEPDAAP